MDVFIIHTYKMVNEKDGSQKEIVDTNLLHYNKTSKRLFQLKYKYFLYSLWWKIVVYIIYIYTKRYYEKDGTQKEIADAQPFSWEPKHRYSICS